MHDETAGWTVDLVAARLAEAARALRSTRSAQQGPSPDVTWWPAAPGNPAEGYGYSSAEPVRLVPEASAISRMDEALEWLRRWLAPAECVAGGLPEDAGRVVWWRAAGWSWPRISAARAAVWGAGKRGGGRSPVPSGNSHTALAGIYRRGCQRIADGLNELHIPVPSQAERDDADASLPGRHVTMGRVMERWERNVQPCGACAHYVVHTAAQGACRHYLELVQPMTHAQHPIGEPCWRAKRG